jgi:hypothetical protein
MLLGLGIQSNYFKIKGRLEVRVKRTIEKKRKRTEFERFKGRKKKRGKKEDEQEK